MNIWNVVEELVRNPDKEFKTTDYYGGKLIALNVERVNYNSRYADNVIVTRNDTGETEPLILNGFIKECKWKEVKKSVTFMEAAESNKRIKVEHPLIAKLRSKGIEECCEYLFLGVLLYRLSEYCSSSEIRNIILDGDWFIE